MDFNLLFRLVATLSFSIKFNIDTNNKQDFFIFNGENTTAHLFRENETLNLFIRTNSSFKRYEISNITTKFEFSWNEFKVDGRKMEIVKSHGQLDELQFNGYTFLSPWLGDPYCQVVEPPPNLVYRESEIKYGLLALIALAIGLILKSDAVALHIWEKIKVKLYQDVEEDLYVEMT